MAAWTVPDMALLRDLRDGRHPIRRILLAFPDKSRDEVIEAWNALTLRTPTEGAEHVNRILAREKGPLYRSPPSSRRYFRAAR